MMTCLSVEGRHLIGPRGSYLYAKRAKALLVGLGARSSGDLSNTLTAFQTFHYFNTMETFTKPTPFHEGEVIPAPPAPE